jgi:hypothetical protein
VFPVVVDLPSLIIALIVNQSVEQHLQQIVKTVRMNEGKCINMVVFTTHIAKKDTSKNGTVKLKMSQMSTILM